ncbi:MAG: penicillin acylase family protein [Pseudomonadota bacterium]
MRIWVIAAAIAASMVGSGLQARATFDATIARTTYGIPHISSDTWQGVGYGVAYAYAEDNVCMLAEEFATIAGERSLHFGPENSSVLGFREVDNLTSDIFYRSQIDLPRLRNGWHSQSEESRMLVEGYVAGYNRFLRDHQGNDLPVECRDKPWVRSISLDDMLRLNEKQMLLASSLALAPGLASAAPPGPNRAELAESAAQLAFSRSEDLSFGSNGWAFGADATANGRGLVIGNPHFPWEGPGRFWQLHVAGPGGYNVMGVGIAGTPIPTLGFNQDVAWTHTVTAARHFTVYALTLSDDDPTVYMVDGEPVEMEAYEVSVPMPDGAPDVVRTLYTTRFGPVVTVPGTGVTWTDSAAYTLRDANTGNQRAIDAWLRIGKSRNVAEVEAAVSLTLGIPWVNTIAADRDGNALHADVTAVPNVSAEKIADCSTPLSGLVANLVTLLDGARSDCDWDAETDAPVSGLMVAFDQAVRVRQDYVTNSNDSYWISNPRDPYRRLSPILGDHEKALTLRTRSNFMETEAALSNGKVDHDTAKALVFGNKSLAADMTVEPLLALCSESAETASACEALRGWDRKFELDSRGAYLFARFWEKIRQDRGLWEVPFDAARPIETPHTLVTDESAAEKLLTALAQAAADLEEADIPLEAPWGEVLTRRAGDEAIPIHGGPGVAGVLNMQIGREIEGGLTPRHGSSYIQIVGFDENGPVADAILSYSQSTNPASPYYADQTRKYSAKQWHRLPFTQAEIDAQQISEPLRISE